MNKREYDEARFYMQEFENYPIIDCEQEIRLAKQIELGRRYTTKASLNCESGLEVFLEYFNNYLDKYRGINDVTSMRSNVITASKIIDNKIRHLDCLMHEDSNGLLGLLEKRRGYVRRAGVLLAECAESLSYTSLTKIIEKIKSSYESADRQFCSYAGRYGKESRQEKTRLDQGMLNLIIKYGPDISNKYAVLCKRQTAWKSARDQLAEANLRIVPKIAKKYTGKGLSFADLICEGNIGLMNAVDRFKWSKGYRFCTFAAYWIQQAIGRAFVYRSKLVHIPSYLYYLVPKYVRYVDDFMQENQREPTHEETACHFKISKVQAAYLNKALDFCESKTGSSSFDLIVDKTKRSIDEIAVRNSAREETLRLIDSLDPRARLIMTKRYGLDGSKPMTLEEIGRIAEITRERVRQIEKQTRKEILADPIVSRKLEMHLV
jgi:RNA polymerase primary sigma factor